jgi:hypothetical protein
VVREDGLADGHEFFGGHVVLALIDLRAKPLKV